MAKNTICIAILLMLLTGVALAQDPEQPASPYDKNHQVGLRVGTWVNAGGEVPENLILIDELNNVVGQLETNISDVNAYFEGYFAYNLFPSSYIELSIGIVNRGSVTVQEGAITDIGNLIIYPILLQFKFYPLRSVNSRLQPYFGVGGGLYYGRQDVQFTTGDYFLTNINEDSETDFNYTLSGGADWLLSDKIAAELNLKYMPINFSQSLINVRDYDALAITVGIKYLYGDKK